MSLDLRELEVVYCGDAWGHRTKTCGLSLTDQLLISVRSVRANWSSTVGISFVHTQPIPIAVAGELDALGVQIFHSAGSVCDAFPMANKILPQRFDFGNKNVLYLDCDTIVHRRVEFDDSWEFLVAYDALQAVSREVYLEVFQHLGIDAPEGRFSSAPSFEYYYNDERSLFPLWNAGVYYVNASIKRRFYDAYLNNFWLIYEKYMLEKWRFYIEQLALTTAVFSIGAKAAIFPKGINFICTPRAYQLREWPADDIVIEHYAGDTSRPLALEGGVIRDFGQV